MLVTHSARTPNGPECRLPVPPLRRGEGHIHLDIAALVAEHFHQAVDVRALEQVLQPLSDGAMLSVTHALAARSSMHLDCRCGGSDLAKDTEVRLRSRFGIQEGLAREAAARYEDAITHGRRLGIDFFDQNMPLSQIEEMLASRRLGLVSLDWEILVDSGAVRIPIDGPDSRYLLGTGAGERPYFYPVVPLVGYDDASMLVHTYARPFLPIEKPVFERARYAPKAQHALIFILGAAHARPEAVTVELETGGPLLYFPGAFKQSVLVAPLQPPRGLEPLNEEEAFKAVTVTKPACELPRLSSRSFHEFIKAAFLRLAAGDPTGEAVKILEEELGRLHELYSEAKAKDEEIPALPSQNLLPPPMTSDEVFVAVGVKAEDGPSGCPPPQFEAPENDCAPAASDTAIVLAGGQGKDSLLQYAIRQSRLAYAILMLRSFGPRQASYEARAQGEELSAALAQKTKEIALDDEQARYAKTELLRQSKSWRVINFLQAASDIQNDAHKIVDILQKRERDFPMFGPKVLLTCAPGRLYGNPSRPEETCPADTVTLGGSTFMQLSPRGLVFSMLHYDYKWGALTQDAEYSLTDIEHRNSWAKGEGPRSCYELTKAVNLFPALEAGPLKEAVAGLHGPEFGAYVGKRSNWFGETLLPSKPWLSGKDDRGQVIKLLAAVTAVLKGEASKLPNKSDYKRVDSLEFVLNSSFLMNAQGESLLFRFVKASVAKGISLKDVVLEKVGSVPAAKYLARLREAESLLLAPLLFEEREGGKLVLTQQGLDYLIKLFDPGYAYHHTGADNVALQEITAIRRRDPFHFDIEAAGRRLRLES